MQFRAALGGECSAFYGRRTKKAVVRKEALRKNPDERYQAVNKLADDLKVVFSDADTTQSGGYRKPTDFKMIGGTDPAFVPTGEGFRHTKPETIRTKWSGYKIGFAVASVLALGLLGGFWSRIFRLNKICTALD